MPLQTSIPRFRPVIRVFVSSTFSDMKHERNALQAEVFPKLEHLCLTHGFQFEAIDLRWGVSTEAGLDHRTMRICFDELRRAQEISPEPNFLILLGDRYGWRPLPEAISHAEFEELATAARTGGDQHTPLPGAHGKTALQVLEDWYRCDKNIVPRGPSETDPNRGPLNYILQPRTQNLRDGRDYTRRTDDPPKDTQDWLEVQGVLWRLVNAAFPATGRWLDCADWPRHVADVNDPVHPKPAIPQLARFQASATEQEIWCGALSAAHAERHVIACFRQITNRDNFTAVEAKEFFDVSEGDFDATSARRQADLKAAIERRLGENMQLPIPFSKLKREQGNVLLDAAEADTKAFCHAVFERFRPIIERQMEEFWDNSAKDTPARATRELKIEQEEHTRFGRERGGRASFVGRNAELAAIRAYLNGDNGWPLAVHGSSGCGKTALLWRAYEDIPVARMPIIRLIGTTPHSSDLRSLLGSLCQELRQRNPRAEPLPIEIKELRDEFSQHLQAATPEQPLILFLDALDQLADADNGRLLSWLPLTQDRFGVPPSGGPGPAKAGTPNTQEATGLAPGSLPPHVKLVVSCLSDRATGDPAGQPYTELQRRPIPAENFINLDVLSEAEARLLLFDRWLAKAGRQVSAGQRACIEQRLASPACRQPIFLKLLFEEVQLWHSYDPALLPSESVPALLGQLFGRLSQPTNHGPLLVNRVLGYLSASRHGLAENELLEILFVDPEYRARLNEATEQTRHELPPNAKRIPIALWSRLRFDLAPYLTERAAPGANVLTFYHRQVAEWVQEHFGLAGERSGEAKEPTVQPWQAHPRLAEYFTTCAKGTDPQKEWQTDSVRGFSECVFHLTRAGRQEQAAALLTNFPFLLHKLRVGLLDGVFDDYDLVGRDGSARRSPPELDIFADFFREKAHILRRANEEWQAHKILLQLAVEHADDSPLTIAAEQWLDRGKCDWVWLRRNQRLPHVHVSPCLGILEGHSSSVDGALVLSDGRILSWAHDNTLRLWDGQWGKCLAVLEGHAGWVQGALVLPDGRILSWPGAYGSKDHALRLWDSQSGKCLAILEGHSNRIDGALALFDGRILSWSSCEGVRLWDGQSGVCQAVFEHSGGALPLTDGKLLLWGGRTLWLSDGQSSSPLATIKGNTEGIRQVVELPGRRLLSWELRSGWLRLWDGQSGTCLAVLYGHVGWLQGVVVLPNERILSWAGLPDKSEDNTLRLWDSHSGKCFAVLAGHTEKVIGAKALADGRLLSWSSDKTLRLWNGQSGESLTILAGHTDGVIGALALADGRLISWSYDKTLRLWDGKSGACLRILEGHALDVTGALALADGRLLSWSSDGTLRLWDGQRGDRLTTLEGHAFAVTGALALADGRLLTWSDDKTLRLWDSHSGACVRILEGHAFAITGALALADGRLLSWSSDKTLRLWDGNSGACLAVLEGHTDGVHGALALADGRLLSWSSDKTLRLWNGQSGACIQVFGGQIDYDWNPTVGAMMQHRVGHTNLIGGALALSDGRLLSWSADKTLRLWDSQSGACLMVLEGHTEGVSGALALVDGRLLSWSSDRTLRSWDSNGSPIAVHSIDEGLNLFSEFRVTYQGTEKSQFHYLWNSQANAGRLRLLGGKIDTVLQWHGNSACICWYVMSDGRAVLTQMNGQVCFLQLYHGNRSISLAEVEALLRSQGRINLPTPEASA